MSLNLVKQDYIDNWDIEPVSIFDLFTVRRYRGAVVEVFKRGIHRGVVTHVDVGSMYPIIMIMLNLSPESLRLVRTKPLTGQYIFSPAYIEVPDETIGMQICVEVAEGDSVSRRLLLDFYHRRAEYRALKTKSADSQQQAIKLIMNMVYGYNGMEWARYGSYLVAIITCAVGRFILRHIVRWLGERGLDPLEMDTDGIYVLGEDFGVDELVGYIRSKFSCFDLRHMLTLSVKTYDGMIVAKMKNYVLRKGSESLFKGSGFRGRAIPFICQRALHAFASALFEGADLYVTWNECLARLATAPLSDMEMCVELSKSPDEYDDTSMYAKLHAQIPDVEWGGEIRFVKTVDDRVPLGIVDDDTMMKNLDRKYYIGRMKGSVKRLLEPIKDIDETIELFYNENLVRLQLCLSCGKSIRSKKKRHGDTNYCNDCMEEKT